MSGTTTSTAVEKADGSPRHLVAQYSDSFAAVLPSHIQKPETWVRLAQGALKKGKRLPSGQTELEAAAAANPGVFLATLLDCARLGLEPGTEQFYLTPRRVKGGGSEILGIVGYQGLIELMYRAGAISSVVAECVYAGDSFEFRPGSDDVPRHDIDWDAPDRGALRLVYAFARMKDGATSKVVVLNRAAIDSIKRSSQGADSQYSPWQTAEPAMWLKSAVRQLAKWVPTSSEYVREQLRAVRDVAAERSSTPNLGLPVLDVGDGVRGTGDILDADVIDAELVDAESSGGDARSPAGAETVEEGARLSASPPDVDPGSPPDAPTEADRKAWAAEDAKPVASHTEPEPMSQGQSRALHALLKKKMGVSGDERHPVLSGLIGRTITSASDLSWADASTVIDLLNDMEDHEPATG